MNDERRARLSDVNDIIDDAIMEINDIIDDEQEAYDSMPDSLQMSCRADAMISAIDDMNDVIGVLNQAQNQICKIISKEKKNGKIKSKT